MLQRVALGQTRFNLPGLSADARGAAIGRQLVARFAAVDRLVSFLRLLSAEQSLDDLQPGLRIVYARGGAGTREAIVLLPAAPELADGVAQAVRLAGGQLFTGAGKHFVQFREARAPLGYDVEALGEGAADLNLYGLEQTVAYRIESELPLARLLLRLSLVRLHGRAARLPDGPIYLTARRGLGTVLAGMLHRTAGYTRDAAGTVQAAAALCESATSSAFSPGGAFWIFRIERLPPRLMRLISTTPGLELYLPVTDNVAVAAGYRHPVHLEACRGSFAADRLHLFSPRGVTEVAPLPTLAAIEDLIRIRAPAAEIAELVEATPAGRPDLAVTLRLEPGGAARPPVAALVPWGQAVWLQRLVYALPPTALRAYRVVLLKRGLLIRAADVLDGLPFGTLFQLGAPDVLVPLGMQIRPAAAPELLSERLGATGGAIVVFPDRASPPVRILPEAIVPFDRRLLVELEPALASLEPFGRGDREPDAPVEIENQPLGPMPLWGLGRPG
ncbi:MAG TPA: hypothetical protein VI456_04165 [Polyangia bacterium]